MKMIGHENVRGEAPTKSDDGSTEELKEHLAVAIVDKDRPTFVATRSDVMDRAGEIGTKCSCHAPRLPRMIRHSEESPRRSENRVGNSSEWKIALRLVESVVG